MVATDEASLAELAGQPVQIVPGDTANIKITHPEDFARAERMLGGTIMETRTGLGYDVHRFAEGDALPGSGIMGPKTHRESPFDLTPEEWADTHVLLGRAKAHLDEHLRPDPSAPDHGRA